MAGRETIDGYGRAASDCGDTIELFLKMRDGVIDAARFEISGCSNTLACARAVVALIKDRALGDARRASAAERIVEALPDLPEAARHCADVASAAATAAIGDAAVHQREPWRALYRKT